MPYELITSEHLDRIFALFMKFLKMKMQ